MKKYIAPETTTIEVNTKSLISISTMGENARMDSDVLTKEENDEWEIWECFPSPKPRHDAPASCRSFFLLPPEENISPSGGKYFFLPRKVVFAHTWERKTPHVEKKNSSRG